MTKVCNNSVNSPFTPSCSSMKEEKFSDAFYQTPISPSFPAKNLNQILDPLKPIFPFDTNSTDFTQKFSGVKNNLGMSFTECLGFESSDEIISSFDDLGKRNNCIINSHRKRNNQDWKKQDEKKFPPLLTSLSDNGRRNFMLKQIRENGRLVIVRVLIERPEILFASRDNGRLKMDLVQSICDDEYDIDDDYHDDVDEEGKREEERERVIPALPRCYHHQRQNCDLGVDQHRFVTTV
ncbi:uncharacterized protein LOC130818940 [Amaranthus tricolor]|uniref:uncharacterized protein LOC130818940 n=1 Tax=Amaranthus tricolor TaxID=29722 RepID=UPI0025866701|nr:uncharacterized protein LOC130818940 [Amaranthus tricolor]